MNESREYLIVLKKLSGFNYKAAIVNKYRPRVTKLPDVPRAERSGATNANGLRRHSAVLKKLSGFNYKAAIVSK